MTDRKINGRPQDEPDGTPEDLKRAVEEAEKLLRDADKRKSVKQAVKKSKKAGTQKKPVRKAAKKENKINEAMLKQFLELLELSVRNSVMQELNDMLILKNRNMKYSQNKKGR